LRKIAATRKPDVVLLVDFPEFNLKLAKALKEDGHKVVYYVSPQLWAWRKYRFRTIRDSVDLLLSILPFEQDWYAERGVDHVKFVGNPIAERSIPSKSRNEIFDRYGIDQKRKLIALLPGSRKKEITRHLKTMLEAAKLLDQRMSGLQFAISAAHDGALQQIKNILAEGGPDEIKVISDDAIDLLNAADVTAVASGTATLEAGMVGTPMAVVYRVPKFDDAIYKVLIDVPHFSLINLIAGKQIARELIQKNFTAENLAKELERLLDPNVNATVRSELRAATAQLGEGSPSTRAAEAVLGFLGSSGSDEHR
jgi:lipid-A-disaccharide synthase